MLHRDHTTTSHYHVDVYPATNRARTTNSGGERDENPALHLLLLQRNRIITESTDDPHMVCYLTRRGQHDRMPIMIDRLGTSSTQNP